MPGTQNPVNIQSVNYGLLQCPKMACWIIEEASPSIVTITVSCAAKRQPLHSAHFYEARSSKNIGINNLQNRMPVKAAETLRSLSFTGFAINSFGVDSFPLSDPPQRAKILTKTTSFYIIALCCTSNNRNACCKEGVSKKEYSKASLFGFSEKDTEKRLCCHARFSTIMRFICFFC